MKERWIGVGLGLGAALALGITWTDSAKAFSLGSTVTAQNFLRDPVTGEIIPYVPAPGRPVIDQGPRNVVVVPAQELTSFGGIWDINLGNSSITFNLNSPIFANVTTGVDVYRFQARGFGRAGSYSLFGAQVTTSGDFIEDRLPYAVVRGRRRLDIIFPLGFAAGDFRAMTGELKLNIALELRPTLEPTPVPTPALLPGLVGLGLAVLRQRHKGSSPEE